MILPKYWSFHINIITSTSLLHRYLLLAYMILCSSGFSPHLYIWCQNVSSFFRVHFSSLLTWSHPIPPVKNTIHSTKGLTHITLVQNSLLSTILISPHTHYSHGNLLFSYRALTKWICVFTYLMSISLTRLPHENKNHAYVVQHQKPKNLDRV